MEATTDTASGVRSPPRSRSYSLSSDKPSVNGYGGLLSPPASVSPEAMFIAASAASQIVTNDHDTRSSTWFDQHGIEPSGETALVTPAALKLVNGFLDQLLFNFLSTSRSTSLASLRPAVSEVLKPKLARDAISGADQELHEYLGGGEDEELLAFHNGLEPSGDWDLELVWKRTRLRCMVYSSLGDMEEEDEDTYTEQEQLDGPPGSRNRFSNTSGVVSPAVAIFLTSILEFMGEQALIVAGQAAYHRLRAKYEKDDKDGSIVHNDIADRVVVDEMDVEKVASDRTLGRLWRGWKKRVRSPTASVSIMRSFSRDSLRSASQSRRPSVIGHEGVPKKESTLEHDVLAEERAEHEVAAAIPLPMHEDDVNEIETPWLRLHPEDIELDTASPERSSRLFSKRRPKSLLIIPSLERGLPTPERSQPSSPTFLYPVSKKRSLAMLSPAPSIASKRVRPDGEESPADNSEEAADDFIEEHHKLDTTKEPDFVVMESEDGLVAVSKPSATVDTSMEDSEGSQYTENDENPEIQRGSGMLSGVVAGVTALGASAIAGLAAAVDTEPSGTSVNGDASDIGEDMAEEAEILTSSRVSIGGRISPDRDTGVSRKSSVRSQSIHSLRLVDVASPSRSRHGSIDAGDYLGARGPYNRGNIIDLQRVSSPIQRASTASPTMRNNTASPITIVRTTSAMSARRVAHSAENSISEVDEPIAEAPHSADGNPFHLALPEKSPFRPKRLSSERSISSDASTSPCVATVRPPSFPEPVFVLQPAPSPRASREVKPDKGAGSIASHATVSAVSESLKAPGHDSLGSVPPLTPLREMMEGAPDTSDDEASSIAPSVDELAGTSNHFVPSSNARATPEGVRSPYEHFDRQQSPQSPPLPANRDDDITPRPETYGKSARPLHTSGSNSSVTSGGKLKAVRTSEESAKSDKGRSFEELIHSDQTIQYTLTPDTMRNIESQPMSPTISTITRNSILPPPPQSPVAAGITPTNDIMRPRTASSTKLHNLTNTSLTGLNMNPPQIVKKTSPIMTTSSSLNSLGRPSSNSPASRRPGAPLARDARVEREPLDDFAEFIRSTGPPGVAPPRAYTYSGGPPAQRTVSASTPKSSALQPERSSSSAGRPRYQARDAVVPYGGNSSDLIDFIRQGPPSSNTRENPRIPRTVAPFRTTMDSDQMVGAMSRNDNAPDARNSRASTEVSVQPSVQSSVNSQSALLGNNYNGSNYNTDSRAPVIPRIGGLDTENQMPKRKQRRVKDPYAIDLSDEEDEFEAFVAPKKPAKAEESLIDFLNNVPPPPPQRVEPFEISQKPTMKKSSSIGIMSRFGRRDSNGLPVKPQSAHSSATPTITRINSAAPQIPRSISGISNHSSPKPPYSSHASMKDSAQVPSVRLDNSRTSSTPRNMQKSYQPREAVVTVRKQQSATEELADFLKNTPPPPSMTPRTPEPFILSQHKNNGLSNMFGRKKKMTAV